MEVAYSQTSTTLRTSALCLHRHRRHRTIYSHMDSTAATPTGNSALLTGRHDAGNSSCLHALWQLYTQTGYFDYFLHKTTQYEILSNSGICTLYIHLYSP